MRPKDIRIRFLPVKDCAIVAPFGRARRTWGVDCPRVHPRIERGAGGNTASHMPLAGRWKISMTHFASWRPFALVGGWRTTPRGLYRMHAGSRRYIRTNRASG